MTPHETAQLLAVAAAAYPQYPLKPQTVEVYAELLADLPHAQVGTALRYLLATTDRWPSVAAIREQVAVTAGALPPTPGEAWEQVRRAIRTRSTKDLHPSVRKAADRIGWYDLRNSRNPETMRAHFWRVYEDVATASRRDTIGRPGGIHEALGELRVAAELAASDPEPDLIDEAAPPPADPEHAKRAVAYIREQIRSQQQQLLTTTEPQEAHE